jgi:methylenetetrahydrofolate reductase (NADPH)
MRVTEFWKPGRKPTFAYEFFPAKTVKSAENLDKTISVLAGLKPDFVTVTFGAGGSTREGSRQLAAKLRREMGLEVVAYFAGFGLSPQEITAVMGGYAGSGVENILVVRGDRPRDPGFQPHPDSLPYASDLLTFIRPRFDFCLGAAGYPEGHVRAASKESDLDFLKRKVDLGAEYILTNYFYDNRFFFEYLERARARGVSVPILPGVMPIHGVKNTDTLAATCGASIPDSLRRALAGLSDEDKAGVMSFGVEFAVRQCRELITAGVPGLLFYTMDRWESTFAVVDALKKEGLL